MKKKHLLEDNDLKWSKEKIIGLAASFCYSPTSVDNPKQLAAKWLLEHLILPENAESYEREEFKKWALEKVK